MVSIASTSMRRMVQAGVGMGVGAFSYKVAFANGYQPGNPVNPTNSVCELDFSISNKLVGTVVVELYDDTVPMTARNFRILCAGTYEEWAKAHHLSDTAGAQTWFFSFNKTVVPFTYAMSVVHRVIPGFMLQAGDFTQGNGRGGLSIYKDGKFKDESFAGKAGRHMKGYVGFLSFLKRESSH